MNKFLTKLKLPIYIMNKKLLALLFFVAPLLTFAQEKGIDQQIDEVFGNATGWFVELIFYQIDFGGGVKVFGYCSH